MIRTTVQRPVLQPRRHAADVEEEALVIDTFSPPREDLLAEDQRRA